MRLLVRSGDDAHRASNEVVVNLDRLCDSCGHYIMAEVILCQFLSLTLKNPAPSNSCLFLSVLEKPFAT